MHEVLNAVETERTGGVKLDWEAIDVATRAIVDSFEPCASGLISPRVLAGTVERNLPCWTHPITLFVQPRATRGTYAEGRTNVTRTRGRGIISAKITLFPNNTLCTTRGDWLNGIREVLAHEVTHAMDPFMKVAPAEAPIKERRSEHGAFCEYVRKPVEITAYLNSAQTELQETHIALLARKTCFVSPEHALQMTSTWQRIEDCLDAKARRRFFRMAARVLQRDPKRACWIPRTVVDLRDVPPSPGHKFLIVGLGLLGAAGLAYLGLQYASSTPKLTVARTAAENARLAQLLPEARAFALALIKRAAQLGIRVLVGETYRDDTRQQQLYVEGKTAIESAGWHGFRRAFHLVPWDDQMNRWDSAGRRVDLYTALGIAARKMGGTWFGDKDIMGPKGPFRDLAHFEYRAGTTLAQLRTQAKTTA